MKRQKRDRLERAQSKGYQAGLTGKAKECCPYHESDTRAQWLGDGEPPLMTEFRILEENRKKPLRAFFLSSVSLL